MRGNGDITPTLIGSYSIVGYLTFPGLPPRMRQTVLLSLSIAGKGGMLASCAVKNSLCAVARPLADISRVFGHRDVLVDIAVLKL